MASVCPSVVRTRLIRATRLDECGVPVVGDTSVVTSKGIISVALSPQYVDAEDIQVKNANDELCVNDLGTPQISTIQAEITFCGVDPALFTLVTGDAVLMDDATPTPNVIGFKISEGHMPGRAALEMWSNISGQNCAGGAKAYWYSLLPLLSNAQWGDVSFENAEVSFTVTGTTLPGSGWGVGPFDVINTALGAPSPLLSPATVLDHYIGFQTTVAPPAVVCGFQPLPEPVEGLVAEMVLQPA